MTQTRITEERWGSLPDGKPVRRYTLTNATGARAMFMPYGAAVLLLEAPDRDGQLADVVLGYDTAADYAIDNTRYIGLTVGRFAGRIAGSSIVIDGTTYQLTGVSRDGQPPSEILHGGPEGFSQCMWTATRVDTADGPGLCFTLVSPDGDQGFPGELTASITYHWTDDFRLICDYQATTTRPTVVNLTQHGYFNLAGAGTGDILQHTLKINADFFTFATPDNLPTGEIRSVRGTPFDFTTAKPIGRDINADNLHIRHHNGFDLNYVLRRADMPGRLTEAAVLHDAASGRRLTVSTSEPGLVIYTANSLDTSRPMKGGARYPVHAGIALETAHFPDSPNQPHFPSTLLRPGQHLRSRTTFDFSVDLS